jgi:hypothetical protein
MGTQTNAKGPAVEPTAPYSAHLGTIKPLLLDEEAAAAMLSLSPRKLWELSAAGAIKCIKIGALKRYRPSDLEAWVANGCPTES